MTSKLLVAAALFAAAACSPAHHPTASQTTPTTIPPTKGTPAMNLATRQLQDAEQTWVRALTTSNPDLLAALVDDEFSFIGPDGQVEDREAYLAGYRAMPSQGVTVESIDMNDVKIRVTGDTGVVIGRVVAKVTFQSQRIVEDVRFTRVYQRRGTGWRMIAGQGTRLAPQPAG